MIPVPVATKSLTFLVSPEQKICAEAVGAIGNTQERLTVDVLFPDTGSDWFPAMVAVLAKLPVRFTEATIVNVAVASLSKLPIAHTPVALL